MPSWGFEVWDGRRRQRGAYQCYSGQRGRQQACGGCALDQLASHHLPAHCASRFLVPCGGRRGVSLLPACPARAGGWCPSSCVARHPGCSCRVSCSSARRSCRKGPSGLAGSTPGRNACRSCPALSPPRATCSVLLPRKVAEQPNPTTSLDDWPGSRRLSRIWSS